MRRSEKQKILWDHLESCPKTSGLYDLCDVLGSCGEATFYRILRELRDAGYEIPCDSKGNYSLSQKDLETRARSSELGYEEAAALLLLFDRLERENTRVQALNSRGQSFPKRISSLRDAIPRELRDKVRWLSHRGRAAQPQIFSALLEIIAKRQQCEIQREGQDRRISPIRLISYRDVWYLDAFCHMRGELRSFALDRISSVRALADKAKIPLKSAEITQHFESSFGIFSGAATQTAVLHFSGSVLKFISNETWHPKQVSKKLSEDLLEISFPIGDKFEELVGSILSVGSGVKVIAPESLQAAVKAELKKALKQY